ncbi:CBS domain-containing protein [Paenisporosarcina cavernae]|uniref:CBS domain-containing protein n=1 Tax=Paenisporosarcina cavernae TaxID=2320858 RepID=A0A385YUL6_9BACL|nr:CBS domain-containing protein [Paenisporosarcina cavernae]AYC30376.1 CBS domain-containing protein [Paenisporosarcina cavernae]
MKIKEKMSRDIVTCQKSDLVHEIAQSMRALDIGCMPVVERGEVIGMITDRDIVTRSVAKNNKEKVEDVMTKDVISAHPDDSIEEASALMAEHRIRRLPVMENNQLVGFLSLADLAVPSETTNYAANALHEISEPRHL